MSKAGPAWLKRAAFLAADIARRWDPQLAHVYCRSMTVKGNHHTKAVCEVAVHLLDRVFHVLKTKTAYELRTPEGHPIGGTEARQLIEKRHTVTDDVRRRRRSKKPKSKGGLDVRDAARTHLPARNSPSTRRSTSAQGHRSRGMEHTSGILRQEDLPPSLYEEPFAGQGR